MKKFNLLLVLTVLVFACGPAEQDDYSVLQNDHLNQSIEKSLKDFETEVYNTGLTEVGSGLLETARGLHDKLKVIQTKREISEIQTLTTEFIELSKGTTNPIDLPNEFLEKSLKSLTPSNLTAFNSNLKLYLLETINAYHKAHSSGFAMFDLVRAFVDSDDNYLKYGSDFHAEIGLEAASSALHPQIFVKFEGQDEFIPINVSNRNNRGEITISKPRLGTNKLYFKIKYLGPHGETEFQTEHEFQVTR